MCAACATIERTNISHSAITFTATVASLFVLRIIAAAGFFRLAYSWTCRKKTNINLAKRTLSENFQFNWIWCVLCAKVWKDNKNSLKTNKTNIIAEQWLVCCEMVRSFIQLARQLPNFIATTSNSKLKYCRGGLRHHQQLLLLTFVFKDLCDINNKLKWVFTFFK